MSAKHLDSTLSRIEDAYGQRPYFVDLDEREEVVERRPVHDELDDLHHSEGGYANWCEFVEARPNLIPTVQLADPEEMDEQVERLWALGRGLLVPVREFALPLMAPLVRRIADLTNGGEDVVFLIDYGRGGRDLLLKQAEATGYVRTVAATAPRAFAAISASSFPDSFVGIERQDIFERQLFDGVVLHAQFPRLIYSDRGSARAERQSGGGGTPAPRIDYAQVQRWTFFRDEGGSGGETIEERRSERIQAYIEQARLLVASDIWDPNLALWGTQLISRAALGDRLAITSAMKATAARINIHLHRQLFYNDPAGAYDTDEEWTD
jgi:hypothetical protein